LCTQQTHEGKQEPPHTAVFGSEVLQRETLIVVTDNLFAEPGKTHLSYKRFTTYMDCSQAAGKQPTPVTSLVTIKGK
jgi:hypothetical protein